jgi:exosortase E/protease (VPEID-CTERM system)
MASESTMQEPLYGVSKRFAIRWLFLLLIAASELVWITSRYEVPSFLENDFRRSAWLFNFSKEIWSLGLWVVSACLVFLSPRLKIIFSDLREQSTGYRWQVWLVCHLPVFAAFAGVTELIFGISSNPSRFSSLWFASWFVLAIATLGLWLTALAPGHFWYRLIRREYMALLIGGLLGVSAWMLIQRLSQYETSLLGQEEFWSMLSLPTMQLVYSLLSWFYTDLVYQPEKFLLGTTSFQVKISYVCSGVEGVSLITLFLALYLWLFRKELRFPQVFWLFPLGIIIIWLANVVRIALLIAIGASFSSEIALRGFHAQAGWIIFTLIALGAIALSNRMQFFTVTQPDFRAAGTRSSLAAALLVPLLVLMAVTMVTSAFSGGFDSLYPLRVMAIAAMLFYFRKSYHSLGWKWTWEAPAIGIAVFIVWILLEPNADGSEAALPQGLAELTGGTAAFWLCFRVLGSVIAIPLAEELAFRGYLIRKLIAKDFERVPLGQFTWLSFLITSVLFGLLHERWLAGTLAGMGYALALYRRGQLGDAVVAHMTTNALIALLVLTQARWSLWT